MEVYIVHYPTQALLSWPYTQLPPPPYPLVTGPWSFLSRHNSLGEHTAWQPHVLAHTTNQNRKAKKRKRTQHPSYIGSLFFIFISSLPQPLLSSLITRIVIVVVDFTIMQNSSLAPYQTNIDHKIHVKLATNTWLMPHGGDQHSFYFLLVHCQAMARWINVLHDKTMSRINYLSSAIDTAGSSSATAAGHVQFKVTLHRPIDAFQT